MENGEELPFNYQCSYMQFLSSMILYKFLIDLMHVIERYSRKFKKMAIVCDIFR